MPFRHLRPSALPIGDDSLGAQVGDSLATAPTLPTDPEGDAVSAPLDSPLINGQQAYLSVVRQPEEQHRARYMSEGSRGAIKGRFGKSHCTVQLVGYNRATRLEVYAGTGCGPLGPHLLYRAIPVTGKGGGSLTTPCKELTANDGLSCVQLTLRPDHKMTAVLDCVGILKICGHEMRRRVPKTERNTSIRLVFRAYVPNDATGQEHVLQAVSDPISCVQQLGYPEVQKVSLVSDSPRGGAEIFILGKNFDKNTKVIFREWDSDGNLVWISEAKVDKRTLHQCHLVCEAPTYKTLELGTPVEVSMTLECGKKTSHPQVFFFSPTTPYGDKTGLYSTLGASWAKEGLRAPYPRSGLETPLKLEMESPPPSAHSAASHCFGHRSREGSNDARSQSLSPARGRKRLGATADWAAWDWGTDPRGPLVLDPLPSSVIQMLEEPGSGTYSSSEGPSSSKRLTSAEDDDWLPFHPLNPQP